MRIGSSFVGPSAGIARAALLIAAPLLALVGTQARADFIVANQGSATNAISRYKDNGALMWSAPLSVYANSSGITATAVTTNVISADGSTVYATVDTSSNDGGEIMALNALTGAVINTVSLAGNGFKRAYGIAAASDGTFWLNMADSQWHAVHFDANFNKLATSAAINVPLGAPGGRGIGLDGAGNPIISCCSSGSAALFKFDKSNLNNQTTVSVPASLSYDENLHTNVNTGVGRGIRWYNNALYMALDTSLGKFNTASGGCNYKDAIDKFTEDANGNLVEVGPIATLLTPCSGNTSGAGFTNLAQDLDGNFWVTEAYANAAVKYSPTGQLLATVTGLNGPSGIDYVYAPEPASVTVLGLGVAGLIASRRRTKR